MPRPNWNDTFLDICHIVARRSTCIRVQTAAILVKDRNIISIGYNGTCSNQEHCNQYWERLFHEGLLGDEFPTFEAYLTQVPFPRDHHHWSLNNELHAEMNCITNAAKNGLSCLDSTLYTLYAPCTQCSKLIVSSGVKRVIYRHPYPRDANGLIFLQKNNIYIERH